MTPLTKKYVVNRINCPGLVAEAQKAGNYVYVGRPSKWGNPFHIGNDGTRTEVIAKYRAYLLASPALMAALLELRGKVLGCSCFPLACHADVLAEYANAVEYGTLTGTLLDGIVEQQSMQAQVRGVCRGCNAIFIVGKDPEHGFAVMHAMPPCEKFLKYEPYDFLRWNRGATEN